MTQATLSFNMTGREIFIVLDGKQLKNGFKKDMWKNIFQKNSFILTATINKERKKYYVRLLFQRLYYQLGKV